MGTVKIKSQNINLIAKDWNIDISEKNIRVIDGNQWEDRRNLSIMLTIINKRRIKRKDSKCLSVISTITQRRSL